MLLFYKEKKYLLISLLLIILDGTIGYFMPSYFNKLNYFYPMLIISFLPFICLVNKISCYFWAIIIGIIYDLLYSSFFLYNLIIFIILVSIDIKIIKIFKINILLLIILCLINIIIYDSISFFLVVLTQYQIVTIYDLFYKIKHSLLLNFLLVFVVWFLYRKDFLHA